MTPEQLETLGDLSQQERDELALHGLACLEKGITAEGLDKSNKRWRSETCGGDDIIFKTKPGPEGYKSKYIYPVLVIPVKEKSE